MDLAQFGKYIASEAAVIAQAPAAFFVAFLVATGISYSAASWAFSSIISNRDATIESLEARLKLRDDQLADKLHSTPPNEARAIIAGLEERLSKLSPRRLENQKRSIFAEKLRLPAEVTYRIEILHDGACADCNLYAADFSTLFSRTPGWSITNGIVIGPGSIPPSGLAVITANAAQPSGAALVVINALKAAEIPFDTQSGSSDADVRILFTARSQ